MSEDSAKTELSLDLNLEGKTPPELERALLTTALNQVVTRIFGMTSIPAPIAKVAPVVAQVARERGATVTEETLPRPVAGLKLIDIDCGFGHKETIYVVGATTLPNTFLIRKDWWRGRIGSAKSARQILDTLQKTDSENVLSWTRGRVKDARKRLRNKVMR
jgi:hypothetical protein